MYGKYKLIILVGVILFTTLSSCVSDRSNDKANANNEKKLNKVYDIDEFVTMILYDSELFRYKKFVIKGYAEDISRESNIVYFKSSTSQYGIICNFNSNQKFNYNSINYKNEIIIEGIFAAITGNQIFLEECNIK